MTTVFTKTEQTTKTVDPKYAITAARFIIDEYTQQLNTRFVVTKPKLTVAALDKYKKAKKVTIEKVNEITAQLLIENGYPELVH